VTIGQSTGDQTAERVPEVWGRIPPRNKNFTGREELLTRLRDGIVDRVTAVVPHALHGLGGVGKTQMAVEYAFRYRSQYELVWWIPADQPILVRSWLAALAPHLGLEPATTIGIEDATNAVLDALRRGVPYRNWLLIFDNADEPEEINDVVPRGPGHVLITSRNHRWTSVADTVAVDVFTREESVEFLRKRVPHAITEAEADQVAEELGDLPLALEQAGALQAETGMTVPEYLRLLRDKIGEILAEGQPAEYPRSMTAAWRLSVTSLESKFPEAVSLLRYCAFFGPEPIPRDAFSETRADLSPSLAGLVSDRIKLSRAIGELGRYALARLDIPGRTLQIHRLIQALLRDDVPAHERDQIRGDVHLLLAGYPQAEPEERTSWPRYRNVLSHIEPAQIAKSTHPQVRALALNVVLFLFASGDYPSALGFVDGFLKQWSEDSGEDHIDVIRLQLERANILRELGDYSRAEEANSKALASSERVLGRDHELTLRSLRGAGADLRAGGYFREARERDELTLEAYRKQEGPEDPGTLRAIHNLALDYGLNNDYPSSRQLHELAYQGHIVMDKSDKAGLLSALSGLARAVRLCGYYGEACDLGEDAYSYGVEQLGPEHNWTLRAAKDLSVAWRRMGGYDRALELALEVHARCVRLFGLNNPDTLAAAMCLSNIHRARGDLDEAYDLAADTVRRYSGVYGPDHPYNHGCSGNLAILLRANGDYAGARKRNEAAMAGLEAKLGRDHHYTLTVAANLASDLAALGELTDACNLGRGTLRRLSAALGDEHPMALQCAANLSVDLEAAGEKDEARELYEQTERIYRATLGMEHPDARVFLERRHLDGDFDPPPI
jgi:tetratricopeptide (TPR) repeat protein